MTAAQKLAREAIRKLKREVQDGPLQFYYEDDFPGMNLLVITWLWGFQAARGGNWHAFIKAVEDDFPGSHDRWFSDLVLEALDEAHEPWASAPKRRR